MISLPEDRISPCPLRRAALQTPRAPALAAPDGSLTFAVLDGGVSGLAEGLKRAGVREGSRVGVYMEKGVEEISLLLALLRVGAVAAPLSDRLPPAAVLERLLRAGCDFVVSPNPEVRGLATSRSLAALRPEDLEGEPKTSKTPKNDVAMPLDRAATVIFTSGSTGRPKAALHTFGNHYASAAGSNENIALSPGDVWLHSLPLYHVGGLSILFRCLLSGAAMALPKPKEPVGEAIARTGATHVSLVSTQLQRLLDEGSNEGSDPPGVKAILLGASAMPPALLDEAHRRGLPVHTSYGMTEMVSQVTTTRPGASREELATSGSALPYRRVRVSPDGEVLVSGETLFSGYIEEEGEDLARPFDEDGFFHTRDLGALDARGLLTITGRKDNRFVSGGENVQPEEVEAELRRLEGVEDAIVVPVEDDEFGLRPVAFVKDAAEREPDRLPELLPELLRGLLRERLPGFAVPVAFHGWPEDAPAGMKVDRSFFRLRAEELRRL